jgi:hypothetical protein
MLGKTRAQRARGREPCRIARRDRHVDIRQRVLVQPKRFTRETLQVIARDGAAARASCDRKTETRVAMMVGEHGQAKVGIRDSLAILPNRAKLGRLVQALARLERQFR